MLEGLLPDNAAHRLTVVHVLAAGGAKEPVLSSA